MNPNTVETFLLPLFSKVLSICGCSDKDPCWMQELCFPFSTTVADLFGRTHTTACNGMKGPVSSNADDIRLASNIVSVRGTAALHPSIPPACPSARAAVIGSRHCVGSPIRDGNCTEPSTGCMVTYLHICIDFSEQ